MTNKKIRATNYYQPNEEKLQKRLREFYRNLSEDAKIKKRNIANNRNKNMTDEARESKKEYL